ncbi:adenine deaminase [Fulvivirgaceae bacterium BMA10]|uniref:Adenine deaminase n=1 Tax=Splendidivirga corallicola TaxID=3051826 RepID=A0ABT8KQH9_9BACT|nr:adenine deaminase [Fulvivirgaceae bacterium BMA10]
MSDQTISGNIVDVVNEKIFPGELHLNNGTIEKIVETRDVENQYILPGFIDSHVHIESSMLVPSEFARLAVVHGTVATISDPHEIGNVLGVRGVNYMIENGKQVNFKFYFGAPSCVPATPFETAGAEITANDIAELFKNKEIKYLAEMMNWPGVLNNDPGVFEKIRIAQEHHRKVDGHAPGLKGDMAKKYISAGISTDHECFTKEEALDKLKYGMKIIIREGSAAKNFEALAPLLDDHADQMMFCSDDKHPDSLVEGHINLLVKRAIEKGTDLFKVLKAACVNPVKHYDLSVGLLRNGDPADFIVIDDLEKFNIQKTFIDGKLVAEKGNSRIPSVRNDIINNFHITNRTSEDFALNVEGNSANVIEALDGQLITNLIKYDISHKKGYFESDVDHDILKIVVINRYRETRPAVTLIKSFGLKEGAIASSVGHDSHNIIAVGVDDESITRAVNLIIDHKGGVSAVSKNQKMIVPLPVAGLMSIEDGYKVAIQYSEIDRMAKRLGSNLSAPFMTLSFMALLVIPSLKLSDKGLFDGDKFEFVKLFSNSRHP